MHLPEDERLGELLRAIRRRLALTQAQLAALAEVPRDDVIKIERGRAGEVRLNRTRRLFAALGARARLTTWWNGAAADRLLDERHAALVERALGALRPPAFRCARPHLRPRAPGRTVD